MESKEIQPEKSLNLANITIKENELTQYTCPMHPEIMEDNSGVCPKCKMGLLAIKNHSNQHSEHNNHDKHAGHNPNMFKAKFWVSFLLTIPVLLYSHTIMELLNFTMPSFAGSEWITAVPGTVIFFYGGLALFKNTNPP